MKNRISGLLFEDRARTVSWFRGHSGEFHPLNPIDISAEADKRQGISTHVKLKLKKKDKNGQPIAFRFTVDKNGVVTCDNYNIDMACAFQFWCLRGHHRLVIGFYHTEIYRDENGQEQKKIVVTQILEIILTEETFRKIRGDVTLAEIEWIKATLLAWKPEPSTQKEADAENEWVENHLHIFTKKMRTENRIGIAKPVIHVDTVKVGAKMDNKRIQSTISIREVIEQVLSEDIGYGKGKYRNENHQGSEVQDRVILYDINRPYAEMTLPWETMATTTKPADGWKIKKINVPKDKKPSVAVPDGEFSGCARNLVATAVKSIVDGALVIRRFEDEWRILQLQTHDPEVRKNFEWACRMTGAMRLGKTKSWLATLGQAKRIHKSLSHQELSIGGSMSNLSEIENHPGLYRIHTGNGHYLVKKLPSGDWSIRHGAFADRPRHKDILERRAACAFKSFGLWSQLRKNEFNGDVDWIVPSGNDDLLEKAALALIQFTYLEKT